MVNLLDLKYLSSVRAQVKDLAQDEEYCGLIIEFLDQNPDVRDDLSDIYVLAVRTRELAGNR